MTRIFLSTVDVTELLKKCPTLMEPEGFTNYFMYPAPFSVLTVQVPNPLYFSAAYIVPRNLCPRPFVTVRNIVIIFCLLMTFLRAQTL
jgi:hypothetical protein